MNPEIEKRGGKEGKGAFGSLEDDGNGMVVVGRDLLLQGDHALALILRL